MFICMSKINFIIHFFLETLHFKESCDVIGILTTFWPITRETEFCQIWDWWWNINNNITFHFRLFSRKTDDKIFQKIPKTLFWGHLDPFCPNLGKIEFFWEKGLCQFLNIPIIYHRAKNQKKLMSHSWEKCRTDGQTDMEI